MSVSKALFCDACLHTELRFSSEQDGDYSFTVNEFLTDRAPAMEALQPGMTSQMLYLWLVTQGGCLNCISKTRQVMQRLLAPSALAAANESLNKDPAARRKLEELHRFIGE